MATTAFARLQSISNLYLPSTKPANSADFRQSLGFRRRHRCYKWKALDSEHAFQGTSSNYAKEMERHAAKESLRLAFKDSGGFKSLISGKVTEMHQIDVNERIVGLERLNPTPRPTTSHFLEGRWNFEWFSAGSNGLFASKLLLERFPATLAALVGLDVLIKDGFAKIAASLKFLNSIEGKFLLTSKLSVEGPTRMKEEYAEGLLEPPTIIEQAIPEQLKDAFGKTTSTLQQLPASIKDAIANGLRFPLGGIFQRLIMISYLDEEILIIRDSHGAPEVLARIEDPSEPVITDYES